MQQNKKGFTLIEILLVIAIIAILAGIVLVAINPTRQIAQANDAQRSSDVAQILKAVNAYAVDNRGALPAGIPDAAAIVGDGEGQVDICDLLVPTYIPALPVDPTADGATYTSCAAAYNTGYTVFQDAAGRVTVTAPSAEVSTISVTQ